jgi:hypothetical protein
VISNEFYPRGVKITRNRPLIFPTQKHGGVVPELFTPHAYPTSTFHLSLVEMHIHNSFIDIRR